MYTGPNIVKNGLVLNLDPLNIKSYPGSGTNLINLVDTTTSMSLNNSPTFNDDSLEFNGSNQFMSSNLSGGDLGITDYLSIGLFANFTGGATGGDLFGFPGYNPRWGYTIRTALSSGQYIAYWYYQDSLGAWQTSYNAASTNKFDPNIWNYICLTNDNGSATTYINGKQTYQKSLNASGWTPASNNLRFTIVGWAYFSGSLGNAHIYNRVLTPEEVQQNYNALKARIKL